MAANTHSLSGVVPVMLTPFSDQDRLDQAGLGRLTDWYLGHGSGALFAVCQSSEMQFLSLEERVELARLVVSQVNRQVPVLASGHMAEAREAQFAELKAMSETGIDVLVLVTNRLDPVNAGFDAFRSNLTAIMAQLPDDLPLGLYECPAPFRRLLSDDEIKFCRDTGRFVVLKDVSCDLGTVKRRIALTEGTDFAIINANAAIAHDAMKAGSPGFAGVFTNFHPDLYAWLYRNRNSSDTIVGYLRTFLALSANAEPLGYPVLAKLYHRRLGTFASIASRSITYDVHKRHWAIEAVIDHIQAGTEAFRERIRRHDQQSAA